MAKKGRPSKYKEEYAEQAAKLCALGATDMQLADFFNVCEKTINTWKSEHSSFLQSIKESKALADEKVERSLFERATGYSHPEDKVFNNAGHAMVVPTIRHYPPDTTAAMFWLQNRKPGTWKNVKHVDHTTKGEQIKDARTISTAELERIVAEKLKG